MTNETYSNRSEHFKKEASRCNNGAWDLIERPSLDYDDIIQLLTLAATARHYWHREGSPNNIAHADLLFAWALARAGVSDAATVLADSALSYFTDDGEPWELAFAHAAKAAAYAAQGDLAGLEKHYAQAKGLGATLTGPDGSYFAAAFKTVPRPQGDTED